MPIQPPHPPANITAIPPPQDPPTLQDLTNAIRYVEEIKAGYREFGYPTVEDLATAYTYRSMVINARAEVAVAPSWLNEAMTLRNAVEVLEDRIDQVNIKVDQLNTTIQQVMVELRETAWTTNKVYNMQLMYGTIVPYKVVRFVDGSSPNDHGLPALHSTQDIYDLDQLDVRRYMRGYGLPSDSEDPKRAIAAFIGCSRYE